MSASLVGGGGGMNRSTGWAFPRAPAKRKDDYSKYSQRYLR